MHIVNSPNKLLETTIPLLFAHVSRLNDGEQVSTTTPFQSFRPTVFAFIPHQLHRLDDVRMMQFVGNLKLDIDTVLEIGVRFGVFGFLEYFEGDDLAVFRGTPGDGRSGSLAGMFTTIGDTAFFERFGADDAWPGGGRIRDGAIGSCLNSLVTDAHGGLLGVIVVNRFRGGAIILCEHHIRSDRGDTTRTCL